MTDIGTRILYGPVEGTSNSNMELTVGSNDLLCSCESPMTRIAIDNMKRGKALT